MLHSAVTLSACQPASSFQYFFQIVICMLIDLSGKAINNNEAIYLLGLNVFPVIIQAALHFVTLSTLLYIFMFSRLRMM